MIYKTAQVSTGELIITVSATGTIEPVNKIEVGSEISGTIKTVSVNANDRVKQGQALARLHTEQLLAKVKQARAALLLANAKVKQVYASVKKTKNSLARLRRLEKSALCPKEQCDAAQAEYDRAEAELLIAKAQTIQAQALLETEQTSLTKATILSPIDGIVLKRAVESGQTVAATLKTPVLFVLAEDLKKMQLHVAIDEADIGQVKIGQTATFTVPAYPDKVFPAIISELQYAPQTIDGVVTYQATLQLDNSALLLRPGMSANIEILVKKTKNALLIPNSALYFNRKQTNAQDNQSISPVNTTKHSKQSKQKRQHKVWILHHGKASAITVITGASNAHVTEIKSKNLKPGARVITDEMMATQ